MPLYEYRCNSCHRRVTILIRDFSASSITCPNCGSTKLERLFSSFAITRSDMSIYDDILYDSQLVRGMEHNDPRALAEWEKRMSRGAAVAPEYEEMMERMEAGGMPTDLMSGRESPEEL